MQLIGFLKRAVVRHKGIAIIGQKLNTAVLEFLKIHIKKRIHFRVRAFCWLYAIYTIADYPFIVSSNSSFDLVRSIRSLISSIASIDV